MKSLLRPLTSLVLGLTVASAIGCGSLGAGPRTLSGLGVSARPEVLFAKGAESARVVINYATRKQLSAMASLGVDFHGFDHDTKRLRTQLDAAQYDAVAALGVTITPDAVRARNNFDPGYRTYLEMVAELQALASKRGDVAELVDIGDSWEKTQKTANREVWALHITKKSADKKPVVLFAGCHHARELMTPEIVLKMAHHLVDGYGTDAEATGLVDSRDIWLVPMVNPDGHVLAEQGADQRKNTNKLTGGKRRLGVDLNRNYGGPQWSHVGSSGNPESDTFHGTAGFSEPEVAAMRDLMRRIKPTYLLTFHSYSNVVLWPWGYTEAPPPDPRLALVGNKLGALSGYKAGQSSTALYATAGDDTDFAFAELGTLAYTVEIGGWSDGFDPPYSSLGKFWDENKPMMLFTLRTADNPAAAAGPELRATGKARPGVQSAKAVQAEFFLDKPGQPGRGSAFKPGDRPLATAVGRHLVWSHAKDARGQWGPWDISWSK